MTTPYWQRLLADDDAIRQVDRRGLTVLTDGGEPANRLALSLWNALRDDVSRADAHAALAVILAESFDDPRALLAFVRDFGLNDALLDRAARGDLTPEAGHSLAEPILDALRTWIDGESIDPPDTLLRAAARLRIPDGDTVYLPLRRAVIDRRFGDDTAERTADLGLLAAVAGEPDSEQVARTVLSYWGAAEPVDAVPTADPEPGRAPASWAATYIMIGTATVREVAERLLDLAFGHDARLGDDEDGRALVQALVTTRARSAEDRLFELAKADAPISSAAVRAIAQRRRRLAGAPPAAAARVSLVLDALVDTKVITAPLGPHAVTDLLDRLPVDATAPEIAMEAVPYAGGAGEAPDAWDAFWAWADATELPEPDPVPPPAPEAESLGGFLRGLFRGR